VYFIVSSLAGGAAMEQRRRRLWMIGALVAAGPVVGGGVALATGVAATRPFPGFVGYIRAHPWPSVGVSVAVAAGLSLALWVLTEQPATDHTAGGQALSDLSGPRDLLIKRIKKGWVILALSEALTDSPGPAVRAWNTPDAVDHPSGDTPSLSHEARRIFTWPSAAFSHHNCSLLILGDRGTGKSVYLYRLLNTLLRRAERDPDAPIPFVFNLAAWNARRGGLAAWMSQEVERYYGIPGRVFDRWLTAGKIIPLFDRLDEIPAGSIDGHIDAVNKLKRATALPGIVVCVRTDKYREATTRLEVDGAVTLEPVSLAAIDQLLKTAEFASLARLVAADGRLRTFLQNRLALTLAYRVQDDLRQSDVARIWAADGDPMMVVLDLYIGRLYRRYPDSKWSEEKTRRWLHWLACYMVGHGIGVLHPLWIQPDILRSRSYHRIVTIGSAILVMAFLLLVALPVGLFLADVPSDWEYNNLPNSLMLGLFLIIVIITGIVAGYDSSITPIARTRWVWPLDIKQLLAVVGLALAVGIVAGTVTEVITGPAEAVPVGAIFALGMAGTLITFRGLYFARENPDSPNLEWDSRRVIGRALRDGAAVGAVGGTCFGIYVGFIASPLAGLLNILEKGAAAAVVLAALNAVRVGGRPLLQHGTLQVALALRGLGPVRYHSFLAEAADRRILARVDHSYMFTHGLVTEYFTLMEQSEDGQEPTSAGT
jgi:hypothetical protein